MQSFGEKSLKIGAKAKHPAGAERNVVYRAFSHSRTLSATGGSTVGPID
jgi:hypothetical protein